ncbi:MAG: hypothetical protein FWD61_12880 [Phycisphaerales bacterium]|nr:hypothetical protein [Phycisphaerales bacterium]
MKEDKTALVRDPTELFHEHDSDAFAKLFYAASEGLLWRDPKQENVERVFTRLTKHAPVNECRPEDEKTPQRLLTATLSLYGDGITDVYLGMSIKGDTAKYKFPPSSSDDTLSDTEIYWLKYIADAFGGLRETIRRQHNQFLEEWCRRLRLRVAQKTETHFLKLRKENAEKEKTAKTENKIYVQKDRLKMRSEAEKEGLEFGFKAVQYMILTLFADVEVWIDGGKFFYQKNKNIFILIKKIYFHEDPEKFKKEKGQCPSDNQSLLPCIKSEPFSKCINNHEDRCRAICKFCTQARASLFDGLSRVGKLKGVLSSEVVKDLHEIAETDPLHARILIRGDAGGGKGVVAGDFHAYCMREIARKIQKIEEVEKKEKNKEDVNEQDKKDADEGKKFLNDVQEKLEKLAKLPPIFACRESSTRLEFIKKQVEGTRWWTWNDKLKNDDLKKAIRDFGSASSDENFVKVLKCKILAEDEKRENAKWDFNYFQMNCGILGGSGEEMPQTLARLFGTSGTNDKNGLDAKPGLF